MDGITKNQIWRHTRPLSLAKIIDAFPHECAYYVPTRLIFIRSELKPYFDMIKLLQSDISDPEFSQFQILLEKEIFMPRKKIEHLARLKSMERLMCKTTRGITDLDISAAKEIDIWSLYDFQGRRGNVAKCPFHNDRVASFSVKSNK